MLCGKKCRLAGLFASKAMTQKPTAAASTKPGLDTKPIIVTEAASRFVTGAGSGAEPEDFLEVLLPCPAEQLRKGLVGTG